MLSSAEMQVLLPVTLILLGVSAIISWWAALHYRVCPACGAHMTLIDQHSTMMDEGWCFGEQTFRCPRCSEIDRRVMPFAGHSELNW